MSRWGRAQDALYALYEIEMGYSAPEPGIVRQLGITWEQWGALIGPILEAVVPIFDAAGPQPSEETE